MARNNDKGRSFGAVGYKMNEYDSGWIEVGGKRVEKESAFETRILVQLTKHSDKYPLLTREQEQHYLGLWQEARDALYSEAQRVYGKERYPNPTSWESPAEAGVIKAIITPGSKHYNPEATEARQKMVLHNLRLLKRFGKTNKKGDVGLYDQHIYALKGLLRAIEKYDRKRINANGTPNKFSTYAVAWLRFMVQRSQVDCGRAIRIPIHIHDQINKLGKIYAQLASENFDSPSPTAEQLSQASGIPVDQVKTLGLWYSEFGLVSLDRETFSDDEESNTLLDSMAIGDPLPEEVTEKTLNKEYLHQLIDEALAPEDAKFAKLYYGLLDGECRSVREMASALGVPRAEIQKKIDGFMLALQAKADREKVCLD